MVSNGFVHEVSLPICNETTISQTELELAVIGTGNLIWVHLDDGQHRAQTPASIVGIPVQYEITTRQEFMRQPIRKLRVVLKLNERGRVAVELGFRCMILGSWTYTGVRGRQLTIDRLALVHPDEAQSELQITGD